jgi:cobalt/nickel transport system permease protein/cobalt/nickel transport protein
MNSGATRAVAVVLIVGMVLSVVLATAASFYASQAPDGLEAVAEEQQFAETAEDSAVADSAFADYGVSGLEHERLSVGLAGLIGVLVTAAVAFGLFALLRRRADEAPAEESPTPNGSPDNEQRRH